MPAATRIPLTLACALLAWGTALVVIAQPASPFDLVPRLDSSARVGVAGASSLSETSGGDTATQVARNPFDLVGRSTTGDATSVRLGDAPEVLAAPPQNVGDVTEDADVLGARSRLDAFLAFGLLLLLAVSFALQGGSLRKMWGAIGNDNLLSRLQRDQRRGGYYLWGFLGAVSLGAFLFTAVREVGAGYLPATSWRWLDIFILGAIGATLAKLFILTVLRAVFPLSRPVDSYRTLIIVWVAVLGVALFPFTVIVAFASPVLAKAVAFGGLGIVALAYVLRALRAMSTSARVVSGYPLHFFMYLCALEIGPVAVAYKLLTG